MKWIVLNFKLEMLLIIGIAPEVNKAFRNANWADLLSSVPVGVLMGRYLSLHRRPS